MRRWPYFILAFCALLTAVGLWSWNIFGWQSEPSVEDFLTHHWERPIPVQGEPPEGFDALEASLDPESCAACHDEQFRDWQNSLHSQSMGPGIRWQLQLLGSEKARGCLECHAPLAEQVVLSAMAFDWPGAPPEESVPDYIPRDLHDKGLVCAACHVRKHERFGPPHRAAEALPDELPHNGFNAHRAFQDSRFCAACHQFPEDGARLEGKLREDTYNQWKDSFHAAEGRTCQTCHMPDRRHLWRGIHDPDMTEGAVEVTLEALAPDRVRIAVANTGAGHHFPTYMVPEVAFVLERRRDEAAEPAVIAERVVAWRPSLDLEAEEFDTRIPSGEKMGWTVELERPLRSDELLQVVMRVAPKKLYERQFEDYLSRVGDDIGREIKGQVQAAVRDAQAARFERVVATYRRGVVAN